MMSCTVSLLSVGLNLVSQISGTCEGNFSFLSLPDMVVDLAHLVVQLIHAVEQSHSKGFCHGEKVFSKLYRHPFSCIDTYILISNR